MGVSQARGIESIPYRGKSEEIQLWSIVCGRGVVKMKQEGHAKGQNR
jgi:hypothetical protein